MTHTIHQLNKQILKNVQLDYLLHLPADYDQDFLKKWPLILFLHGAGERGSDVQKVKQHGIPKVAERDPAFPFIAVSPQCPEGSNWNQEEDALLELLNDVMSRYQVDPDRVYLTGLSMGGYGTWHLASVAPERFAAIVPICGGGSPFRVTLIKGIPVWAFHGTKDEIVPQEETDKMVKALEDCGGKVKYTVYPDAGHDSWTETYDNPELYEWLLSHVRGKNI